MNALEMVTVELVKLLIFSIVWYLIARFYYPYYSKKVALDIMDDDEYVEKTQQIQETWMHAMVTRETDRLSALVRAEIGSINFDPDILLREMREWFPKWFKGWYSGLIKADNAVQNEQDGETTAMVDMAKMNRGNPQAMDAIKAWAVKRNPNLAVLVQLGEMLQNNGSRSPPRSGSGGY